MLVDVEYRSNNLIISYIDKNGQIKLKYKNWSRPTKFIKTSDDDHEKSGQYVTWDGSSVKEIYSRYPNKYSIFDFIDSLPEDEKEETSKFAKTLLILVLLVCTAVVGFLFLLKDEKTIEQLFGKDTEVSKALIGFVQSQNNKRRGEFSLPFLPRRQNILLLGLQ